MTDSIDQQLARMQALMYGYNYEVCVGIDIFKGSTSADFAEAIKKKYPQTNPHLYGLIPSDKDELFNDISDKLNYRGDSGAGLKLTIEKEATLKSIQDEYLSYINHFISESTQIYQYPDPEGIPGYPVFWEYRYVLFADNDKILLVYGSASD